jgi:O-antigen ligase
MLTNKGDKKVAHNLYLQVGAESGFPALLLLVFFYFQAIRKGNYVLTAHKRRLVELDPVLQWGAGGAVSGLLGYMAHSVFSAGIHIESPYVFVLVGLAAFRLYDVQKEGMQDIREQERALVHAMR